MANHEQAATDSAVDSAYVLPKIDEECDSESADSITEAEMLECITGNNTFSRSCEVVTDSGLYSEKDDDHTSKVIPHEQDHYMSDKHMIRASPNSEALLPKDPITISDDNKKELEPHPSVTSFGNDSILSISSSGSDDEESTSHPDYYTAAKRTTSINSSGCSIEVGQCSDHYVDDVIKKEDVVCEDGGVADDD